MRFIDAPLYARQIILTMLIIAFTLAIIVLFTTLRLCKRKEFIITSIVEFVLSFLTIFMTMRGSYLYRTNKPVFEPSFAVIKLPLWIHLTVIVVLLITTILSLIYAIKWSKKNLSETSIKESADTLPAGICFYDDSGIVRLINIKMNNLCILVTGKALLDGVIFWQNISNGIVEDCISIKTGEEPIIECNTGKVYSFKKYIHSIEGKTINEVVAIDITEKYNLTKELKQKLDRLKIINKRLIEYGDNVTELAHEKELLAAKIRIHDDIGKILLATKRKLTEDLTEADKKDLINFWQAEISALKNANHQKRKNDIQVINDAAELIGVKIKFIGGQPTENTMNEKILVAAMHECLTNTVSHANGKTMIVTTKNQNDKYIIIITNDGDIPKSEIIERGGLSSLRLLVENEDGKMIIHSKPRFELVIEIPKGEDL